MTVDALGKAAMGGRHWACCPGSYPASWRDGCREVGRRAEKQGPHDNLDAVSKLFLCVAHMIGT